jgi:hypothetical protein
LHEAFGEGGGGKFAKLVIFNGLEVFNGDSGLPADVWQRELFYFSGRS